ncbi:hypothetical protein [Roseateles terrae]|uniref:DUF4124 domain-containing protein n=1 Tax=Roseateles terrae TaxID=431060 RepID=A0ABR6GXN8_9BURK|nr:hypothetical protein [Roseateles terrae]MBB3196867.1 hypothetical protein [Roseateles terrae]OWQ84578.1 hypothetical protein CDN98_18930 [Roseateles terrae]
MRTLILAFTMAAWSCTPVVAQKLPQPSREVFKCEVNGKVTYSDAPCLGARKVDVEPTRGLTSTGKEAPGADVQRERINEGFAEAIRPVTGKDAKQLQVDGKRLSLAAPAQVECRHLDAAIPAAEQKERVSDARSRPAIQRELLALRQRFIQLRC